MDTPDLLGTAPSRFAPHDDAPALAAALKQSHLDIEAEKSTLARVLHDDIGGLLVGVIMDMGWIANQPGLPDGVKEKLARAQGLMRSAIAMKRDLVETLKPTLLDNVGLYPTLRWHLKASCNTLRVPYTESLPESDDPMSPELRLGVFRIFQAALKDLLSRRPTGISVKAEALHGVLHVHVIDQSDGGVDGETHAVSHSVSPITSMHLRAQQLGGTLQWSRTTTGAHLHLQVPLATSVQVGPQVEE